MGLRTPNIVVLAALMLVGCPDEPTPIDPQPIPLASADTWSRVTDPSVDTFADQRPAGAVCDDLGWVLDPFLQVIEIETDVCDYLTLHQATLEPLQPGDVVTVRAYHDVLTAPDPAQGYLGLAIDGEIEWEYQVAIPAAAADIEQTFTIDRSIPAGSDIQVHVHNHGANTWELIALLVTAAQ